jgi:hypothetical protein
MKRDESFDAYFSIAKSHKIIPRSHGLFFRRASLRFYLNYLFQGVSFEGKSMLDIGGVGLFSLYGACTGAKPVICLEPGLEGGTEGIRHKLRKLCDNLPPPINTTPRPVTFREFQPGNETFDITPLHNSINHLDEEACINLQHNDVARNRCRVIFSRLSELAAPGAKLIIVDCSRRNFWHRVGLPNVLAPSVEWHKRQSPRYWSSFLSDYGFINPPDTLAITQRLSRHRQIAFWQSYYGLFSN